VVVLVQWQQVTVRRVGKWISFLVVVATANNC